MPMGSGMYTSKKFEATLSMIISRFLMCTSFGGPVVRDLALWKRLAS